MIFIGIVIGIIIGCILSIATLHYLSRGELIVMKDEADGESYFNLAFKSKSDIYDTANTNAKFVIFKIRH